MWKGEQRWEFENKSFSSKGEKQSKRRVFMKSLYISSITVESIESIMLYGSCFGMLGVDLPCVCLSA